MGGSNKRLRVMIVVFCVLALVMVYKNFGGGGGGGNDATVVTTTSVPALAAPGNDGPSQPSTVDGNDDTSSDGPDSVDAPVNRNPFTPAG